MCQSAAAQGGCRSRNGKRRLEKRRSRSKRRHIASDERRREYGHRTPSPHGTTRHCQILPSPALGGLFVAISKRDPATTFNRNFHIDA